MAVLVTMGARNSTGSNIRIGKVVRHKRRLNVTIIESEPGTSCGKGMMITSPTAVEIVPRTRERFIEVTEQKDCH